MFRNVTWFEIFGIPDVHKEVFDGTVVLTF